MALWQNGEQGVQEMEQEEEEEAEEEEGELAVCNSPALLPYLWPSRGYSDTVMPELQMRPMFRSLPGSA